jgi:hypothetical protein
MWATETFLTIILYAGTLVNSEPPKVAPKFTRRPIEGTMLNWAASGRYNLGVVAVVVEIGGTTEWRGDFAILLAVAFSARSISGSVDLLLESILEVRNRFGSH